ncbi:hypothetical protein [Streptomyces sp. NPDC056982]|uniref:hypothetical protein n=1 Tax=Streptomyces sp. NPDC056982 TaxID=3345986 RepID=UPI0036295B29
MLASLLPGIRELRTPLAAGYMYLLSLFLLLASRVPTESEARPPLSHIYDAVGWMGKPAAFAVGTFVAYLVGSVLEWRAAKISRRLRHPLAWIKIFIVGSIRSKGLDEFTRNAEHNANSVYGELDPPDVDTLDAYVKDRMYPPGVSRPSAVATEVMTLVEGLPQLRTRLYGANKDMYGDYDRLAAEADFKVNVGLAGMALGVVAAIEVTPWWAFLFVPMAVLFVRGLRTIRQANGVVVQAVVAEVVKSPKFEQLVDSDQGA